jgi:hypothetical protein
MINVSHYLAGALGITRAQCTPDRADQSSRAKRMLAAGVAGAAVLSAAACSSGGAKGSASGCTNWVVSQDGAVVASEISTVGCDKGNLLTPSAGTLTHVSGVPAHGIEICDAGASGGIDWVVYAGTADDPNGEASSVCDMFMK